MTRANWTIDFHGGAGTVTGANFLLTAPGPTRCLVDCGFFQGSRVAEDNNREPFPYDPASLDALFVTHAHLDHIGRIPKLVREGFRGKIYSTPPTKALAELSLIDSLGVLEKEAKSSQTPLLYQEADVRQAMSRWQELNYHQPVTVGSLTVRALNAGHILGSAMFEFMAGGRQLVFTGDLGNSPSPLLPDTEPLSKADYLVMESVYGDRNHEGREAIQDKLEDIIENTIRSRGVLLVPAFSIERTQELLYEIEQMMEFSRIPLVPVFLDSPLAIQVTALYSQFRSYLKEDLTTGHLLDQELFQFPQLHKTLSTEASRAIVSWAAPKVIIAGSGMSNGGRILHHEKRYLSDPTTTLLLVGYQAAGSLGRRLQAGAKTVTIHGETVTVRAKVVTLSGYSAHKDSDDLLKFVGQASDTLRHVWVTMGEPKASLHLVQRIRDHLGLAATAPQLGERAVMTI